MKKFVQKVSYIAGGIIIGVVFSTTSGAFADTVKSMVGKKVTGEYTIVVDGKKLSDKGAVIDSKANVPARALSEALGAEVKVDGRTITITTDDETSTAANVTPANTNSKTDTKKYAGYTKSSLEDLKKSTIDKILTPTKKGRDQVVAGLEEAKKTNDPNIIAQAEQKLSEYDAEIAKYEAEIKLIDEALLTAK
ncbi:copper amine oxidase [Paenibacillus sp. RRE4]|uniref:stalk domain-containing protein n=1 Tax=Paenibacillus sp. RRE4 TaxID=2962587 RepID=UPI002881AA54|nr:stalk domain-containing protein [Paenibacillus sp. RRE4]MDT0123863.1 copper amine oxidase [Paenibacillus sp. RRE4]